MWLLRFRVYALSVGSAPSRVSSLGKPGNPTLLCGCVVLRSRVCDLSVGSAPSRDSNLGKPRNPTLLYGCVAVACYRKDVGPPVKPRTSRIATTRTPREAPGSHYKPKARKAPGTPGKPQDTPGSPGRPRMPRDTVPREAPHKQNCYISGGSQGGRGQEPPWDHI
jgi:hypothetical protein